MRALALGSMMLPVAVLACTGGSAADDAVRAPLSAPALRPASIGSAPTATKHVRLVTRGSVNDLPSPQQPTSAPSPRITLAVDAVAGKWFDGLVGQVADVTLQSSSSQQQVPIQVNLRGVFGASHSLTPLNGGTEDECTQEVNIDVGDAGFLG